MVARLHLFVNAQEHERAFPGAKTICVPGFRRRFKRADGREDPLAANFSYANAFVADHSLHGAGFFVDDTIARLVSVNVFALNVVRYACFVNRPKEFDPAEASHMDARTSAGFLQMPNMETAVDVEDFAGAEGQ